MHLLRSSLTCQLRQTQLSEPQHPLLLVVEQYGQCVGVLVQTGASDHSQVLQRQKVKLVENDEDVASHLPDGLERGGESQKRSA